LRPARDLTRVAGKSSARASRRARGITLIELMVVIAIITMVMGIGVGVWIAFRSSSARGQAFRNLVVACRRARVFSLEESAPSRLIIKRPKDGPHGFHAEGLRLVGYWHLESSPPQDPDGHDPLVGFAGRELEQSGGAFHDEKGVIPGYSGTGIYFKAGGTIYLPVGGLRLPRGGQISFDYLGPRVDRKQGLVSRGKDLEVTLSPEGRIEAQVASVIVAPERYRLPRGRWSRIALFYSSHDVRVIVDGVVRAHSKPDDEVELPEAKELDLPLEIGSGEWKIYGYLDNIAVHRTVREGDVQLPAGMRLECDVDEIHFDSAGMLDRRFHSGPVKIVIVAPKGGGKFSRRTVAVDLMGNVREEE
jgi:prepilin-type N-terminal cleavage/methylation domain-containing protein